METPERLTRTRSDERLLDAESASRLLRRAAEIDAGRGDGVTVAELRRAAVEAGISAEAFDFALQRVDGGPITLTERTQGNSAGDRTVFGGLSLPVVALSGVMLGALMLWFYGFTTHDGVLVIPFVLGGMLSLTLAALHRGGARLGRFLAEHVVLWASLVLIFLTDESLQRGPDFADVLGVTGVIAALVAIAGSLIVTVRVRPGTAEARPSDGGSGDGQPIERVRGLREGLRTIRRWLGIGDDRDASPDHRRLSFTAGPHS
jgi:hypothetical protein